MANWEDDLIPTNVLRVWLTFEHAVSSHTQVIHTEPEHVTEIMQLWAKYGYHLTGYHYDVHLAPNMPGADILASI